MRAIGLMATLLCAVASPARAGVFSDDLTRCMVAKTSESDRSAFMAWMFSVVSSSPELQKLTVLDRDKRDRIAATAADVFQRLVLVDCRKEAVAALKAEGDGAVTQSFAALGRAATEQMFQSPQAQAELESLSNNFDRTKLKALGAEAGIAQKKDIK